MKNRAFTLLELLVVITIIGILASIVVVSMSGSTDSATIAKGKSYAQQVHALLGHEAVLDFNFNENAQDTCPDGKDVCDASGYGNHGIFYGNVNFVDSPIDGYALFFDGTGDYVNAGNNVRPSEAITVSSWLNPVAIKISGASISTGRSGGIIQFYPLDLDVKFCVYTNAWYCVVIPKIDILLNEWSYFVHTYDQNKLKVYINGLLKDEKDLAGDIVYDDKPAIIGGYVGTSFPTYAPANYFNGLIDEVRIYSEAISEVEIQKHYVQGLEKLLANQFITQAEYNQRMEEFNQSLASNEF